MEIQQEVVEINNVEVRYTVIDGEYTYQDILVFDKEEYGKMSEKNIAFLQSKKYAEWKSYMTTPIVPEKEEALVARKESIEKQIASLVNSLTKIELGLESKQTIVARSDNGR